jgi:hypothetical protein
MNGRRRALCWLGFASAAGALLATSARAQIYSKPSGSEPERFRGQITQVDAGSITLKTREGRTLSLVLSENTSFFGLAKGVFGEVDLGVYVGSISEKLGEDVYSPIVRDSLSWLHKARELRIIDEKLRGIAVGHTKWDLTAASVMTHGWVDDLEERVISIKYGPTEEEETDVEVGRDIPILRMSLGDRSLLKAGARIFAGAQKSAGGGYAAAFVFAGRDGVVPPL